MKRSITSPVTAVAIMSVSAALAAVAFHHATDRNNFDIREALVYGNLEHARALMEKPHDLVSIIRRLPDEAKVYQRALDVQFEYCYRREEDSNIWYPENLPAIHEVTEHGAQANDDHLLSAAQQGKMETVAFFLDINVPMKADAPLDGLLSNVAYWGDANLLARMIADGADVDEAPNGCMPALLSAAWSGQNECVQILLEHGADIYAEHDGRPIWEIIEERTSPPAFDSAREVWALVAAQQAEQMTVGNSKAH